MEVKLKLVAKKQSGHGPFTFVTVAGAGPPTEDEVATDAGLEAKYSLQEDLNEAFQSFFSFLTPGRVLELPTPSSHFSRRLIFNLNV